MADDENAESLLAKIDELMKLVEQSGSRNGGKARKAVLKEVGKYLRNYVRTKSDSDLDLCWKLLSEFLMGER